MEPDHVNYSEGLLLAYWNRGWYKKALEVCKGLEARDCRSAEFFLCYGGILHNRGDQTAAMEKLAAAAGQLAERIYNSEVLCEAWFMLFQEGCQGDGIFLTECFRTFNEFVNVCPLDGRKLGAMIEKVSLNFLEEPGNFTSLESGFQGLVESLLKRGGDVLKEPTICLAIETVPRKLEYIKIKSDSRIQKQLCETAETFYANGTVRAMEKNQCENLDYEDMEDALLLAKLTIIESCPGIKKGLRIIKDEYPYYRQDMGEFLDEVLKAGSRAKLLNKYEKQFNEMTGVRMGNFFGDIEGFDYSDESSGNDFTEFWEEDYFDESKSEPYKRKEPKIGRNAPCPCGSGKKYKNCCGKH